MENPRRIYNPVQKDTVTFVRTFDDSHGECTVVDVELAPKGGVGIHYHKTYAEKFDCQEGELKVQAGKIIHTLTKGQSVTAEPNINHRFFNASNQVCKFRVELRPGSRGFEQSLQIGYGLACDGQTNSKGFPNNRLALAWLFEISESNLPGWMSIFEFLLRRQAKKAKAIGLDKVLTERYVKF